mmetsp:Transcript_53663/g.170651  ORF Transcript_53663/g.170651 Transcript_53663/m.170651 type:complete len:208 (-) Transcript_53663:722-1345(-)
MPLHVHDHAPPRRGDLLHGQLKLRAAVATAGAEDVPREAFRVDTRQHLLPAPLLDALAAHHESHVLLPVPEPLVAYDLKLPVLRRQPRAGHALHLWLVHADVADEVRNGDAHQVGLLSERLELRQAAHGAVLVDDLAQDPHRGESRQAREVGSRLGVARPHEHPTGAVAQGEDVAGAPEVRGHGVRVREAVERRGAVRGGDAGGGAL